MSAKKSVASVQSCDVVTSMSTLSELKGEDRKRQPKKKPLMMSLAKITRKPPCWMKAAQRRQHQLESGGAVERRGSS
eukprot:scaffold62109_cov54-Phaeocystis_antarctica.AAC.6